MKVIKYVVEIQMIYSLNERSHIDKIAEFKNFSDAINELEFAALIYTNNKNVAIEVVRYVFDKVRGEYKYLDKLIGFYGTDAAKYLNIHSKTKKYGLIIV